MNDANIYCHQLLNQQHNYKNTKYKNTKHKIQTQTQTQPFTTHKFPIAPLSLLSVFLFYTLSLSFILTVFVLPTSAGGPVSD